jgi:endonuclease VIII
VPEGDTIFRTAHTLQLALAGKTVSRFETVLPRLSRVDDDSPLAGRMVEAVESRGKWLSIRFSGGLILLTHMLMSGSWHIYRPGERWQRGRFHMRIVIETADILAVAFDVPIAEFHTAASLAERLQRLGPDVLAPEFEEERAVTGLLSQPELEIGPALIRQSLLAGLGNVYKSEVCFVAGVNPFRNVSSIERAKAGELVAAGRKLMSANTGGGFRRTTGRASPDARLWVYGRAGEPCRRCGATIESHRHRIDARLSFWCPRCQPAE